MVLVLIWLGLISKCWNGTNRCCSNLSKTELHHILSCVFHYRVLYFSSSFFCWYFILFFSLYFCLSNFTLPFHLPSLLSFPLYFHALVLLLSHSGFNFSLHFPFYTLALLFISTFINHFLFTNLHSTFSQYFLTLLSRGIFLY